MADTTDDTWKDAIAGDGDDRDARMTALADFDSPTALFDSQQGLANANWRDPFVPEGDEEFGTQMERFSAPADFSKSFREQQTTLSSRPTLAAPGEGATDEDIVAFRETNKLPAEVGDYLKDLPDGIVLGETDMAIAEHFMGAMHGQYATKEMGNALLSAYSKFQEQVQTDQAALDATQHQETTDELRAEWGTDYRTNINIVHGYLEGMLGKEGKEELINGRYPSGRGFMNNPAVLKGLAIRGREYDPAAAAGIPSAGADAVTTMNDEIAEIEKLMRTDRRAYNADQKMQDRLVELYDIRIEHEKKVKAA